MKKDCWVCLRITPELVLKMSLKIWEGDHQIARVIGKEASKLIQKSYGLNKCFCSSRSSKTILSGLFYLLGIRRDSWKSQEELARKIEINPISIKESIQRWIETFPQLFPDFDFEERKTRAIKWGFSTKKITTTRKVLRYKGQHFPYGM